jgi:protein-disulfide isomerase
MTQYCSSCGNELAPNARFCGNCGQAVAAMPQEEAPSPQAPSGDRPGGGVRRQLAAARAPWTAILVISVVLAVSLVGVAAWLGVTRGGEEEEAAPAAPTWAAAGAVGATGTPAAIPRQGTTLGSPDAALTITEYSDFLCPYCTEAALQIVPQIEDEYMVAGKVKLVFKHFPIHGEPDELAAEAAECAAEQNAFWEYHDVLFRDNEQVGFNIENLKLLAQQLALDTEAFNACLDTGKYTDKVAADAEEARRRGVSAVPTFLVGQTQIVGAKSYSEFKTAIDSELARLGETSETE